MYHSQKIQGEDKKEFYEQLLLQVEGLICDETDYIANLANTAALLFDQMEQINWAGFYLLKEEQLILGPFQGKPACIRIEVGKGVCGTAAKEKVAQVISDVHQFPGHIACDAASNSEMVIPMMKENKLLGVLDIDSPIKNRFDETDKEYLSIMVEKLTEQCLWV